MIYLRSRVAGTLLVAAVAGCAGCATSTASGDGPRSQPPSSSQSAQQQAGGIVRDGYFDADTVAARVRLEMKQVERLGQYSVLRFAVTNLEAEALGGVSMFGASRVDGSFSGFRLVDSVGRKVYRTLRDGSDFGEAFGSDYNTTRLHPRVRYDVHVYFPPIPAGVEHVTVTTPGTTAEISGVPVVDGTRPPVAASAQPDGTPAPGQTAVLKADPPSGQIWSKVEDLFDIVDRPDATTTSGGGGETVALRTDVLFAFDSATLSGKAKGVIAKAAGELTARADPAKPVSIEGHTDGKGLPSYNQPLSERRATAVRDALQAALAGKSYSFRVAGKGAEEPVAKETTPSGADNPSGRARNRRVEISYTFRAEQPSSTFRAEQPSSAAPAAGAPARFRRDDGPVVAERTATVDTEAEQFRLRVRPFYRDGAYLVAAFELTNVGNSPLHRPSGFRNYFGSADFVGAPFGSFSVSDNTGTTYRAVRLGVPENEFSVSDYLSGAIIIDRPQVPGRTFLYLPAPPPGITSVTFDAGPFGKIPNVPVR